MPKLFRYPVKIREIHLDSFGHVNNATYLELYEEARWEMITPRGWGLERIMRERIGPVILEVNLKFKRELVLREEISITTQFRELKKGLILELHQEILKSDGTLASEADFRIGVFDLEKRKLLPPSREWLEVIGAFEADEKDDPVGDSHRE